MTNERQRAAIESALLKLRDARSAAEVKRDEDRDKMYLREGTTPAQSGQVWVCGACGKTSTTRYGVDADGNSVASGGWDESCLLNAVLCYSEREIGGAWRAVPRGIPR